MVGQSPLSALHVGTATASRVPNTTFGHPAVLSKTAPRSFQVCSVQTHSHRPHLIQPHCWAPISPTPWVQGMLPPQLQDHERVRAQLNAALTAMNMAMEGQRLPPVYAAPQPQQPVQPPLPDQPPLPAEDPLAGSRWASGAALPALGPFASVWLACSCQCCGGDLPCLSLRHVPECG